MEGIAVSQERGTRDLMLIQPEPQSAGPLFKIRGAMAWARSCGKYEDTGRFTAICCKNAKTRLRGEGMGGPSKEARSAMMLL